MSCNLWCYAVLYTYFGITKLCIFLISYDFCEKVNESNNLKVDDLESKITYKRGQTALTNMLTQHVGAVWFGWKCWSKNDLLNTLHNH